MSEARFMAPVHPSILSPKELKELAVELDHLERDLDGQSFVESANRRARIGEIKRRLEADRHTRDMQKSRMQADKRRPEASVNEETEFMPTRPYYEDPELPRREGRRRSRNFLAIHNGGGRLN